MSEKQTTLPLVSDATLPDAKPHLSPTQLDLYCKCPEAYRRRYIEREVIPPGIAILQGQSVHRAAEINFRQKLSTRVDLPILEIVEAAAASFDEQKAGEVSLSRDEMARGASVVLGEAKDEAVKCAEVLARDIAPEYQPVLVEEKVRIVLDNSPRDLLCILDMADERGIVSDYKVSGKRKSQADADSSVALTTYAAAHRIATGKLPSELRLEVIVKNKTPVRQVVSTTRAKADFVALAARVNAVQSSIDAGSFPPATPGAWWCGPRWCGYWSTCPYVNNERIERVKGDE